MKGLRAKVLHMMMMMMMHLLGYLQRASQVMLGVWAVASSRRTYKRTAPAIVEGRRLDAVTD